KPPEWWEKQKGSRGIRRGQWYRLVFQFPIRQVSQFFTVHVLIQAWRQHLRGTIEARAAAAPGLTLK
ncbi:hypothetical protein, partial [Klebsiella pneumoniae]|uniref:hypothetical protein n=1 Tax=Klebsiella pneumoniae TaxID=573 RepID=UPI001C9AE5E2